MQLDEADYSPQRSAGLFDGPWLVFAPHADDETFGMGGAIARARAAGIDVHVVVMTDGALGGQRDDLVETREREVARALEILGGATLTCWRLPDRGLLPDASLVDRAARLIVSQAFASVFFPSLIEAHPDHRATARIAWDALRQTGFPALPVSFDISALGPCNHLIDTTAVYDIKKQAMAVYASQEAERPYSIKVQAFDCGRTWALPLSVQYAESFFVYEKKDCSLARMFEMVLSRYLAGVYTAAEMADVQLRLSGVTEAGQENAEIMRLQKELDEMCHSRSWRVTAPLRTLARLFRKA